MASNTSYEVSSQEIRSCAQELLSLKAEYDGLFSKTSSILSILNGNWSSFLANNFDGKINSAQNVCRNVAQMLEIGGKLALDNADNYEKLEEELFKNQIASNLGGISVLSNIKGNSSSFMVGATVVSDGINYKALALGLPEGVKDFFRDGWATLKRNTVETFEHGGDALNYIENFYNEHWLGSKLPILENGKITPLIKEAIYYGLSTTNKTFSTSVKMTEKIMKGDIYGALQAGVSDLSTRSILTNGVFSAFKVSFGKDAIDIGQRNYDKRRADLAEGNVASYVYDINFSLLRGFTYPLAETTLDVLNDFPIGGIPVGKFVTGGLQVVGVDISDDGIHKAFQSLDKKTEQFQYAFTEKVTNIENSVEKYVEKEIYDFVDLVRESNGGIKKGFDSCYGSTLGKLKSIIS